MLVQSSKPKNIKLFKPLGNEILKVTAELLQQQNEDNLIKVTSCLFDLCESDPAFLKQRYDDLVVVMEQVRKYTNNPDSLLKLEAVEALVFVLERYP